MKTKKNLLSLTHKQKIYIMNQELIDTIALSLIKGIGTKIANRAITSVNSASEIFNLSEKQLRDIDGISQSLAHEIIASKDTARKQAEIEVSWAESCGITILTQKSDGYPARLRACDDAPATLYSRGNTNYNSSKIISIVGTRKPTSYGRQWCSEIIAQLAQLHPDTVIVSGLAYGIDIIAHTSALDNNLKTVGVVAHGLDTLYPAQHKDIAKRMVENGGAVLTEFRHGTQPEAVNFVSRNRIVAGMSDLTLVVESGEKGGSLITANKAHSYGRLVAALPGYPAAEMSQGPNRLIKEHKAELITCAEDIEKLLDWNNAPDSSHLQGSLFSIDLEMSPIQKKLYDILLLGKMTVDELSRAAAMPVNNVSSILLEMEFSGLVSSFPGNVYAINTNL